MKLEKRYYQCPAGKQWYKCASPPYEGCCSVDACQHLGCPDDANPSPTTSSTSSSVNTPTPTTVIVTSTNKGTVTSFVTFTPSGTTQTEIVTTSSDGGSTAFFTMTKTLDPGVTTSPVSFDPGAPTSSFGATQSEPAAPSATTMDAGGNGEETPHHPTEHYIVAGVLGGIGLIALVAIIMWYARRRRKNIQERHNREVVEDTMTDFHLPQHEKNSVSYVGTETSPQAHTMFPQVDQDVVPCLDSTPVSPQTDQFSHSNGPSSPDSGLPESLRAPALPPRPAQQHIEVVEAPSTPAVRYIPYSPTNSDHPSITVTSPTPAVSPQRTQQMSSSNFPSSNAGVGSSHVMSWMDFHSDQPTAPPGAACSSNLSSPHQMPDMGAPVWTSLAGPYEKRE